MEIPKKLKVGGHIYNVDTDYSFVERSDRYGHSDHAMKEIKITPVDSNGKKRHESGIEETFIHEILHCVDEVYNAHNLEEGTVERLSQGLYQVLKDNDLIK